jgi:hypothetical protein
MRGNPWNAVDAADVDAKNYSTNTRAPERVGAISWTAAERCNDTEPKGISRNNTRGQKFSEFLSAASSENLWP